ncbi:MAG: hypothetical protein WAS73_03780 [Defluviicoccus sp.]
MSGDAVETVFRVGKRTVTLRVPCDARVAEIDADWKPSAPNRRLNKRELKEYRRGILLLAGAFKDATGRMPVIIQCLRAALRIRWPSLSYLPHCLLLPPPSKANHGDDGGCGSRVIIGGFPPSFPLLRISATSNVSKIGASTFSAQAT